MPLCYNKKVKVADSILSMKANKDGEFHFFRWETIEIAIVRKRDYGYLLSPSYYLELNKEYDASDISGIFQSVEESFSFVSCYLQAHEDFRNYLKEKHREQKDTYRKYKAYMVEEESKNYHIELEDLTPDHNLYYSDIVSNRIKSMLKAGNIFTLKDISHLKRSEFLKYRNCGNGSADIIENLLHHVGLDWNTSVSEEESDPTLTSVSDEVLLAECRKRNLKL